MTAPRVVSLVPSVTETLLAWGVVPVACTRFCEQPDLSHVGGTKDPDVAAIVEMRPDFVVVDEEENRREDADALATAGIELIVTAVRSVDDAIRAISALAVAVGVEPKAVDLPPEAAAPMVRAFVPIWRRPWMTIGGGTYGSSMLARAGVVNVFDDSPDRYPEIDLALATALRPDVVLAPSEPYPFKERHVPELSAVAPVHLVDGRDVFWWGTRTRDAATRLRVLVESLAGGPGPSH